jgi:hypothetical protein
MILRFEDKIKAGMAIVSICTIFFYTGCTKEGIVINKEYHSGYDYVCDTLDVAIYLSTEVPMTKKDTCHQPEEYYLLVKTSDDKVYEYRVSASEFQNYRTGDHFPGSFR